MQGRYQPFPGQSCTLADVLGEKRDDFGQDQNTRTTQQQRSAMSIGDPRVRGINNVEPAPQVPVRTFVHPTAVTSPFTREMSKIATNYATGAAGSVQDQNDIFNQLQLAVAIKMGLNGPQLLEQRALQNVLTSNSARGDIQQILQARAELYGDSTDPK